MSNRRAKQKRLKGEEAFRANLKLKMHRCPESENKILAFSVNLGVMRCTHCGQVVKLV